ncbi:MAG: (Na+)-NQR maturation NqrM [Pseudomonadota bacterium]|nr:(Na+)-NQR maturation NqrM [Pseudomonadota bacterium]MEE2820501.1 (Na+)-NQR maturation NqrM [Pseudomonadota bacterium]
MTIGLILTVFVVFAFLVAIMAVGVIMGRRPISGSCGGIGRINGEESECAICGGDPIKCEQAINDKSVVGVSTAKGTSRRRMNNNVT